VVAVHLDQNSDNQPHSPASAGFMTNLQAVLAEVAHPSPMWYCYTYLTEEDHFREMNTVLGELVSEPFPTRTTIYAQLPPGMLVEIDTLAVVE
jgi:2-iminobutanoate/2-iminopropanoate deaminase